MKTKRDPEEVPVLFRVWKSGDFKGDVDAYFPMLPADHEGKFCTCYAHIGQHGSADLVFCIQKTRPAKPEEYADLKRELEQPPYEYKLRVIKRTPSWRQR